MTVAHLAVKEIAHHKMHFALGLLSVVAAVGSLVGALTLLKAHDLRTARLLARKQEETGQRVAGLKDDVRKAMLGLGFNIVILPKEQDLGDWYADDRAAKYMPEEYVTRLAESPIVTVRHVLPSLRQRVKWPERKRTIILVGTRGEVPNLHEAPKKPLVQPVSPGTIVIGHELHESLRISVGDRVRLREREFIVKECRGERGTSDDITVWIALREAQELLDKKGLINSILALECSCAWANVAKVREELLAILPNTRIIERASKALGRAEARIRVRKEATDAIEHEKRARARLREEREQLAAILVPVVTVASALWIGGLAYLNARQRRKEIGILRALGLRSRQILALFLARAAAMGVIGGVIGLIVGLLVGDRLAVALEDVSAVRATFNCTLVSAVVVAAPTLTIMASWLAAMTAVLQDPAVVLREE